MEGVILNTPTQGNTKAISPSDDVVGFSRAATRQTATNPPMDWGFQRCEEIRYFILGDENNHRHKWPLWRVRRIQQSPDHPHAITSRSTFPWTSVSRKITTTETVRELLVINAHEV